MRQDQSVAIGSLLARACAVIGPALATPQTALAAPASVEAIAESDLEFGTFAVPSSGWRALSPAGDLRDSGILAFPGARIGPARFSIVFDRGNESRREIDVLVQVMIIAPATVTTGNVTASLSGIVTDLPDAGASPAGTILTLRMANCRERRCTTSFSVGGRIDIVRSSAGATLRIPLVVNATLVSAR